MADALAVEALQNELPVARLTSEVRRRALELGFQKVGVARAEALAEERARLEEWLARGHHAGMEWMARGTARRADPREFLPGARTVVVVALNYFTPHEHAADPCTGKISRYAWGDDYHDVLGEKLKALLSFVKELSPEANGKACVDAQPAMDKAWGVRAGLGWIGKHTNLITRDYGSWVFLGELVLDIELEYDAARVEDHCGTCTLCLDACPTGAIVEPYVVDSARCISYATIELRAPELPREVAGHLEGWLYGCDICQDVCPWNRFEQPTGETRFEPREGNVNPQLEEVANLTHEAYVERFRRSPVKRAKLAGLQRNARTLLEHAREAD
ncbi:MAG TPA: tRNA epoxyqueuosine(34) reductase QueG [Pyrinomonadaceae bacterium]|nr:tRNA epoxyqueuosine(34) reductase QueG [Pyrinomonadaceae bacterium]